MSGKKQIRNLQFTNLQIFKPGKLKIDHSKISAGFTLIELLIVVSLSIMLMLTASALFMTFLISNTKTSSSQLIKNEGRYALSQMEFLLRNATEIETNSDDQTCTSGMDEITIKSVDNGITTLFADDGRIASNSGIYLTSDAVELTSGPIFDCTESPDKVSQYINISFTLRRGTPGLDQPRDIVEEEFVTSVNIRTF